MPFYVAAPLSTVDLTIAERRRASPSRSATRTRSRRSAAQQVAPEGAARPPPGLRRHAGRQHHRHRHRGRRAAAAVRPGAGRRLRRRGVPAVSAPAARARATLMAAGLGTRLYPLTGLTAKPMVPILNRPGHGAPAAPAAAPRRHRGRRQPALPPGEDPLVLRRRRRASASSCATTSRSELLGTAGGVGAFREFLADGTFLVMSGDGLTDIDLTAFLAAHRASGGIATMAVKQVADPSLYGVVVARRRHARHRLPGEAAARRGAVRRSATAASTPSSRAIFDYIAPGAFVDWAKDVFPALLARRRALPLLGARELLERRRQHRAVPPQQLRRAARPRRRSTSPAAQIAPRVWVGEGTEIEADVRLEAPVLIGAGCLIETERRAHRPAHRRRRLRHRARRRARGRHPLGRRQGRAATRAWPAASSAATSSSITRPSSTRTPSSATAPRSAPHAPRRAGRARSSRVPRVGPGRLRAVGGDGVTSACRGCTPRGALDGLLDLVFPKRCVSCRAAGAWLCAPAPASSAPLPDDRCPRCGAPLRRAGRPARPSRAGSAAPRMPRLPRVRRPRPRLRLGLGGLLLRGAGARPGHRLQVPRPALAHRRHGGARGRRRSRPLAAGGRRRRRVVTWVPAHRDHRLERGFNQAESLARRLARDAGLPYAPLLRRVRHGARQSGLDRAARAANVHDAFALREGALRGR